MASVQLVLTDDWKLRGNGSGTMRRIQFDSMRALLDIDERHGLKASFHAEVMRQLYHLKLGADNPALLGLAREWERRPEALCRVPPVLRSRRASRVVTPPRNG
jgi:hypothetical protein